MTASKLFEGIFHSIKRFKLTIGPLVSIAFIVLLFSPNEVTSQISVYNSGQPFTCIATDVRGEIWAGTSSNGLWKCRRINIPVPNTLEKEFGKFTSDDQFNKVNMQSIATDKNSHVWVGHNGTGGSTAPGGGVDEVSEESRFVRPKHFTPYSRVTKLQNGGIPSLDSKAVTVDKNGTVWTANGYHDLTVAGVIAPYIDIWGNIYPGIPGQYILTCGGIAYKRANAFVFDSINAPAAGIPYGAYTINTPISKSAGTRQCVSIAAGPTEVWAGVGFYESADAGLIGTKILRFNLDGSYKGFFDNSSPSPGASTLPQSLATTTRAATMFFQSNGTGWVGFNQGRGFAVYKGNTWSYVNALNDKGTASKLLPAGFLFAANSPGLIAGKGSKVFLGTTSGLLMYKGKGDYLQDSSYVLYTTAQGLPSNNIKGVATDNESVWIATDKGIARMPINADMFIYHLDGYPLDPLTTTKRTLLNSVDQFGTDDVASYIAADNSDATVFLYKSINATNLKFAIEENANDQVEINKQEYGYFTVISRGADSVKVQYHHPRFIKSSYLKNNANGREVTLQVIDKTTDAVVFKTKIKFVLPPVLLVHGVWTDISSLSPLSTYLRDNADGYQYFDFQLLRKYRTDGSAEENPFIVDIPEIPNGITELIANCANNNLSAGKVNVVCHSRGGLYTRAYIEEFAPGIPYRSDINSLITLNTPHSGSQYANLVLDKRIFKIQVPIPPTLLSPFPKFIEIKKSLSDLVSGVIPSSGDRISKNGAQVLRVDKGFIVDLNNDQNLDKIRTNKVPVHAIATNFDLCKLGSVVCPNIPKGVAFAGKRYLPLSILLLLSKTPKATSNFIKEDIFNNELNDFIVPKSSMEAGLDDKYISRFEGENIPHADLLSLAKGVMATPVVHKRVADLLQQNIYDAQSNFSFNGYNPPRGANRLRYNLFPWLSNLFGNPAPEHRADETIDNTAQILIDTLVRGKKLKIADTLKVSVSTTPEIKKMLIAYAVDGDEDEDKTYIELSLSVNNPVFNFPIPANFYGKINITAYGFDDSMLLAVDTSHILVGLPASIQLLNVLIDGDKKIDLKQTEIHPYTVKGLYSDSVLRNITFSDSVQYVIRDTSVIKLTGIGTLQAKQVGFTYLIAVSGKKTDSIQVNVLDNPTLRQTLLDNFTGSVNNSNNIQLNWSTFQEFMNAYFVIERSNSSSFDSIGVSKAGGTLYSTSSYTYTDSKATGDTIYYRLRMVDSSNNSSYSRIIMVVKTGVSLPVVLSSFAGKYIQNAVTLNWSTVTEINNKQFDIEASHEGSLFNKIGSVPGSKNSNLPLNYKFDDLNFFKPGKNYYRLKQIDLDGNFKLSPTVVVSVDEVKQSSISLYPNPATNRIIIGIQQPLGNKLQLQLTDITGRKVWSKTLLSNSNSIPLTLPVLSRGVYIISIVNDSGEKLLTDKLVIE